LLVTARKGIPSLQLAKEIGVTRKTAWFVLGRLREACGGKPVPPVLDKMADLVLSYRPKSKAKKARKRKKAKRS
jgi:hypothetical protein